MLCRPTIPSFFRAETHIIFFFGLTEYPIFGLFSYVSYLESRRSESNMADSKVNKDVEHTVDYTLAPMMLKSDKK